MSDSDLLVVGAGAKAAGDRGQGPRRSTRSAWAEVSMTVIEGTEPAASWLGRNGMTSGEEPLAIPPIKDVGFPYQSSRQFGEAGDGDRRGAVPFTWQRFAMERHEYARLGQLRLALGAPPRLRRVPGLGARAGDRGGRASTTAG